MMRPFSCGSMWTSLAIQLQGLDQKLVDQPNDRSRLGDFCELASLVALVDDDLDPLLDVPRDKLVDRVAADPQVLLDPLQNVVAAGQHGIEPEPRQRARAR